MAGVQCGMRIKVKAMCLHYKNTRTNILRAYIYTSMARGRTKGWNLGICACGWARAWGKQLELPGWSIAVGG